MSDRNPGSTIDQFYPTARVGDSYFKGTGTSQAAAVTSGVAALMFQVSLAGVLLIREPPAPARPVPSRPPFTDYFRRLPGLVRANPVFARLACVQLLVGFGSAASPFYVLHAVSRFHLPDAWGGIVAL